MLKYQMQRQQTHIQWLWKVWTNSIVACVHGCMLYTGTCVADVVQVACDSSGAVPCCHCTAPEAPDTRLHLHLVKLTGHGAER